MIYRVIRASLGQGTTLDVRAPTSSRAPGNVPYFVDNIWEWLRPSHMASRRKAAFASPSPELAAMGANGSIEDAWQVKLLEGQLAVQITRDPRPEDAKYHSDIGRLKLLLRDLLGASWYDLPATERMCEAPLFLPCASAAEIAEAFRSSGRLDEERLRGASTFWSDVDLFSSDEDPPHASGEIFFGGSYQLFRTP